MTRLIDADKLKKSTCDKGVCSDCEDFHKGTNVSTNCSEVRWYFLEKINEQPTVDAISIDWINHYMDTELTKGSIFYNCMSEFMRDWQKEQEERKCQK